MRSVTRIFLVVMLFALAIWSVAAVKAEAGKTAVRGIGPAVPAMLIQVDDDGVPINISVDTDGHRCAIDPGMFSAFNDPSMATNPIRLASNDDSGHSAGADSFSLQRL